MDKQIIVYEPNEQVKMEVKTDGETVWLTIDQMAALFGRDPSVIGKHIKAAFSEEELDESISPTFHIRLAGELFSRRNAA